jgi:hypothetical protein
MGSINALPNYTEYFDLPRGGNASTGIIFSIFQVREFPNLHSPLYAVKLTVDADWPHVRCLVRMDGRLVWA